VCAPSLRRGTRDCTLPMNCAESWRRTCKGRVTSAVSEHFAAVHRVSALSHRNRRRELRLRVASRRRPRRSRTPIAAIEIGGVVSGRSSPTVPGHELPLDQAAQSVARVVHALHAGYGATHSRRDAPGGPDVLAKMSPSMAGFTQAIRFCTSQDGLRLAYATTGHGPAVVRAAHFLTHLEFDWESPVWRPWLAELSRDRLLVRYDGRGCGLSDRSPAPLSLDAWVADLEAVVDAAGLERFALFGCSQGCAVSVAGKPARAPISAAAESPRRPGAASGTLFGCAARTKARAAGTALAGV